MVPVNSAFMSASWAYVPPTVAVVILALAWSNGGYPKRNWPTIVAFAGIVALLWIHPALAVMVTLQVVLLGVILYNTILSKSASPDK